MFRGIVIIAIGGFFVGTGGSAPGYAAAQPTGSGASPVGGVRVPGTSLLVSLPAGWEIAPARPGALNPMAVHYKGSPGYDVTVKQNDNMPHSEAVMSLPFECDYTLGALQSAVKFQLVQRPDFIPGEYYSRVLMPVPPKQGELLSTCLYLGNSALVFIVSPAPTSSDSSKITPLLQAIADSGKKTSTLLYAPGSLKLPVMGVTALMSSGIWAVGTTTLPTSSGKTDLLVRISGPSELKVLPKVLPGTCSLEDNPNHRKAPPYISAKWEPFAWEAPALNGQLQLMVCRQIAPAKMLLVTMEYGAPAVPAKDTAGIATALDEIAEAIINGHR
jgi:hypothetical protein